MNVIETMRDATSEQVSTIGRREMNLPDVAVQQRGTAGRPRCW